MATPKKRTGKAKQNARRANWKGAVPATTTCPNCKAIVLTHTVCPECGFYKDGFASKKAKADSVVKVENEKAEVETTEEVKEEKEVKKARKPRAKKAEVETEVKEEVQAEAETQE